MEKKNCARKFVLINVLLSLAFLLALTVTAPSTLDPLVLVSSFAILFILNTSVFVSCFYSEFKEILAKLLSRQGAHETLLLDLRNGTKQYYHEKRKFVRVKKDLTAQLIGKDIREFIKTIDISFNGALLKSTHKFEVGDTIDINLYLPIYAEPVNIKVRVLRVTSVEVENDVQLYNVGVKYLDMPEENRKKLVEAIELLIKKQEHSKKS
jgi:Tfp pilus assembly protein PilZ